MWALVFREGSDSLSRGRITKDPTALSPRLECLYKRLRPSGADHRGISKGSTSRIDASPPLMAESNSWVAQTKRLAAARSARCAAPAMIVT